MKCERTAGKRDRSAVLPRRCSPDGRLQLARPGLGKDGNLSWAPDSISRAPKRRLTRGALSRLANANSRTVLFRGDVGRGPRASRPRWRGRVLRALDPP